MDRSDFLENLANLYLRINGYFTSGFIVHAPEGNLTEIDLIAVRFPNHTEPEVEGSPCPYLHVSNTKIDFVIAEVKGGQRRSKFNAAFRNRMDSITKVLRRIGIISEAEIESLVPQIKNLLDPGNLRRINDFPVIAMPGCAAQLRFILFSPDQRRTNRSRYTSIYGDDMVGFIWKRLHPAQAPSQCSVTYPKQLWGHQFNDVVAYFKDWTRTESGSIDDIYKYVSQPGKPNTRKVTK